MTSQLTTALIATFAASAAALLWFGQLLQKLHRSAKKDAIAAALGKTQVALSHLETLGPADVLSRDVLTHALELAYGVALHLPELRELTDRYVAEVESLLKPQHLGKNRGEVPLGDSETDPQAPSGPSRAMEIGNQLLDAIRKA